MSDVEIETTYTIRIKHHEIVLTLQEAIELKNAMIRAVGAQTHNAATLTPHVVFNQEAEEAASKFIQNAMDR